MKDKSRATRIAVGMTDGYRYVGIEPPLTEDEALSLGVKVTQYNQITAPGPATTLLMANGDFFEGGPSQRTEHAFKVAHDIAKILNGLRPGTVYVLPEVIGMMGHNSTPFNPITK